MALIGHTDSGAAHKSHMISPQIVRTGQRLCDLSVLPCDEHSSEACIGSHGQKAQSVAGVDRLTQWLPPFLVIHIPKHRFPEPGLEGLDRSPAQFFLNLCRINRIAAVVAWPIRNKAD